MNHASRLMPDNSQLKEILKQYWGYDTFRPLQEDIIKTVLSGKDTLALMPTGGGKSLCYQVPAMAQEGLCLVISPLIALMKDQVENLNRKNITAFAIYSGMTRKEVINTLKIATDSNCKFLYVSPERLETKLFKEYLPALNINLIAVDEAHCISQWGYDFRPPYLRIAALRDELQTVPVLALTASATPEVQKDICEKLMPPQTLPVRQAGPPKEGLRNFDSWSIFQQSFARPNLSYSVFKVESKINKIIEVLTKVGGSAIVYCKSRKRTKEISDLLKLQNISSDFYHAGLTQMERSNKQENWIQNKTRVIVCTNAFGMGIDKPDVRVVLHADVPDCLENYYQEAGRAGRDGKRSYAVLLYDDSDIAELENMPSIRFPSVDDIRIVYQSVCNYLQVAAGSGETMLYDFDMNDFIKKFKLNSYTAIYSLKALEQDEWLSVSDQVFIPPTVQFVTNKETLYEFEKTHTQLEPLMKALLRAYEGVFDHPAIISEKVLAGLLKKDVEQIKNELMQLHHAAIIQYQPQKDTPQIQFLKNRVKTEDLFINMSLYEKRKQHFTDRSKQMIHYTTDITTCRSVMTGKYFGDTAIEKCGVCDNCLRQKQLIISKEEFENIKNRVLQILSKNKKNSTELIQLMTAFKKEKVFKVLEHLHAEKIIQTDAAGNIHHR